MRKVRTLWTFGSKAIDVLIGCAVAPTVKHLFNGFDVTLFAYGVTGTGKTHTMRGGKSLADRGVIPRLLSSVYRRGRKIEKDSEGATSAKVLLSYYEIYNDKVYDLFEPPEKRTFTGLPLRDNGGKTVVVGLTERPCTNLKEFESLYDQANTNRSTSATKVSVLRALLDSTYRMVLTLYSLTPTLHGPMLFSVSSSQSRPAKKRASAPLPPLILPALKTIVAQKIVRSA